MLKSTLTVRGSCRCAAGPRVTGVPAFHLRHTIRNSPRRGSNRTSGPPPFRYEPTRRLTTCFRARQRGNSNVAAKVTAKPSENEWAKLGIPPSIIDNLANHYPHVVQPTPGQKLFLASVGAGKEVFFKDGMGRGKTLSLALASLTLALSSSTVRSHLRIMIIVPTPYLAYQISDHLSKLSPDDSIFTLLGPPASDLPNGLNFPQNKTFEGRYQQPARFPLPASLIVLSTAKHLEAYTLHVPSLSHIFLDEPDTLLSSIPSKHLPSHLHAYHRINRHPPPIIGVLNKLLNIESTTKDKFDFTNRRDDIITVWTSATLSNQFTRFVKTRGWVRKGKDAVNLDFTESASRKGGDRTERLLETLSRGTGSDEESTAIDQKPMGLEHFQNEPEHYAIVVEDSGNLSSLQADSDIISSPIRPSRKGKGKAVAITKHTESTKHPAVEPVLLETLALLHASSPPSIGQYSMVLPPEGTSLDQLGEELSNLGVSSLVLTPDILRLGIPNAPASAEQEQTSEEEDMPILLAQRSSVPGLHLDKLQTIYLLSGLDVAGLSPKQRKSGGVRDRWTFYDLVTGRLGRLGTGTGSATEKQRVVSLIMDGSEEQKRLREMFLPSTSRGSGKHLSEWDMTGLQARLESIDELKE